MIGRTFRPSPSMPQGSEVRQGPGGRTYIVITSTTGLDVYVDPLDAHARGWLDELDDHGRVIERTPS